MTKLKVLSAVLIAAATLATPAMARESHVASRHVAVQTSGDNTGFGGHVCIPAPRVGAFATEPWTGNNIPCEPSWQF